MCRIKGFVRKLVVALLTGPLPLSAADPDAPLPTFDSVLQHVLQRAKAEGDNDLTFDARYRYTRIKVTEFRNSAGQLKKHEANTSVHVPASMAPALVTGRGTKTRPRKSPRPFPTLIPMFVDSRSRRATSC